MIKNAVKAAKNNIYKIKIAITDLTYISITNSYT